MLLLACQCAAQGGGKSKTKATYARSRSFGQWEHGLHQDPLILVAFITAVVSVPGFLFIIWPLVYDYIYAAAVRCRLCSRRPLSVSTLERSSSQFFIRPSKH
ncbi:hypothetical protein WJX79_007714 [Trebouxia sp. C0005]